MKRYRCLVLGSPQTTCILGATGVGLGCWNLVVRNPLRRAGIY